MSSDLASTEAAAASGDGEQVGHTVQLPATPRPLRAAIVLDAARIAREFGEEDELRRQFGDDGHEQGLALARCVHLGAEAVLRSAKILHDRFVKDGGKGRDSRFAAWLATYAPELSRKTADRWRAIYVAFGEAYERDPAVFSQFRITALYWLVEHGDAAARQRALQVATSECVTKERAVQLTGKSAQVGSPGQHSRRCSKSADRASAEASLSRAELNLTTAIRTVVWTHIKIHGLVGNLCVQVLRRVADDLENGSLTNGT